MAMMIQVGSPMWMMVTMTVVFVIIAISSFMIMSTMCGLPSETLFTAFTGTPAASIAAAVPRVARMSKPLCAK